MRYSFFLLSILLAANVFSQQDEQSSTYMFNPLQFNPAYAGSRGALTTTAVIRAQWLGIDGAPRTQFISLHTPLAHRSLGVGFHVSNDKAGALGRTAAYGDFVYSLKLSKKNRLNFGGSAGMDFVNLAFKDLYAKDPTEVQYLTNASVNSFNAGAGLYFYNKRFYAGLSSPRLLKTNWNAASLSKKHFFFSIGYVLPLNSVVDMKFSSLIKVVQNAPIVFDLNANVFFYKAFWIGGMFRYNESAGLNIAYQVKEQLMIGYAYDYTYNGLRKTATTGTHELMITYDMNGGRVGYMSPRFF